MADRWGGAPSTRGILDGATLAVGSKPSPGDDPDPPSGRAERGPRPVGAGGRLRAGAVGAATGLAGLTAGQAGRDA